MFGFGSPKLQIPSELRWNLSQPGLQKRSFHAGLNSEGFAKQGAARCAENHGVHGCACGLGRLDAGKMVTFEVRTHL